MASLLASLNLASLSLVTAGNLCFESLRESADDYLTELRRLEAALESEIGNSNPPASQDQSDFNLNQSEQINTISAQFSIDTPEIKSNSTLSTSNAPTTSSKHLISSLKRHNDVWYKQSITSLKSYNSQINQFQKTTTANPKMSINLNDAYIYPLQLDNFAKLDSLPVRQHNRTELTKALILHLLKTGHSSITRQILPSLTKSLPTKIDIDEEILDSFATLDVIVRDIIQNHNLEKGLAWIIEAQRDFNSISHVSQQSQGSQTLDPLKELEFEFHILQYALLLNGNSRNSAYLLDLAHSAYQYLKKYFPQFYAQHNKEISLLMTLLLLEFGDKPEDEFEHKKRRSMVDYLNRAKRGEYLFSSKQSIYLNLGSSSLYSSTYILQVFSSFKNVQNDESLFVFLANELTSAFCKKMKLLNELSIFQTMLAGFVNISNFYKYNQIQQKLGHKINYSTDSGNELLVAPLTFEIPFPLTNTKTNLFKFHPIFICPVSKEQLEPIGLELDQGEHENPVMVLKRCLHLALRDSLWQLSKRGTESFKCHYCYKKHKFADVSEGYFIDL